MTERPQQLRLLRYSKDKDVVALLHQLVQDKPDDPLRTIPRGSKYPMLKVPGPKNY